MKKHFCLLILFCTSFNVVVKAQNQSDSIYKEIHVIELQNNKVVLEQYFVEHSDYRVMVPTYAINYSLVNSFVRNNSKLAKLDDDYKDLVKQCENIRKNTEEFKRLDKKYQLEADVEKKRKMSTSFVKHSKELASKNPAYKSLLEQSDSVRILLNHLILETMFKEYQATGKIMPTTFISNDDLNRYKENQIFKTNLIRLSILNRSLTVAIEEELSKKYPQKISSYH